jgi:gliding motility associated protien GldN
MINISKKIGSFIFLALFCATGYAQNMASAELYNPHSVRPVRSDDVMFKKTLWFRIDCRQKMNASFFAENQEISKLLLEAVKNDLILPFKDDHLQVRMTKEEFLELLQLPNQDDLLDSQFDPFNVDNEWPEEVVGNSAAERGPDEYLPRQLFVFEIKEDILFDRRESRMKHDIHAITLILPAEINPTGLDKPLGVFSYKELVEKVFRNNPNAVWYNPRNSAAHLNLEDAFTLRQFSAQLLKYENPKNKMIVDLYNGGKKALIESERALMQLLEYEAQLWEY